MGRRATAALAAVLAVIAGVSAFVPSATRLPQALIFDCDGVLADTERDGHRPAFNEAFKAKGIDCVWDVDLYGKLLEVGGGKERMTAHWDKVGWPLGITEKADKQALVQELHLLKTDLFNEAIVAGKIPLRPGVLRLVDEAIEQEVPLAVCSTSNERAVSNLVLTLMGRERYERFRIFAGDVVRAKKPQPDIYNLAAEALRLSPERVIVVEDSGIGLRAAKGAGMPCLVTKSSYTGGENFSLADEVVESLDDGDVDLQVLGNIVMTSLSKSQAAGA
ncbi:HAD-like domain-containing protein [Tribonema minus]|uniref:HAD-like domain-containing protein n=1 Tax=Tribonema minus TaxID=303371 RepID=A0A835Z3K7_9STRA|nr:HAD-like domain-containing protein [Tribonema minus]